MKRVSYVPFCADKLMIFNLKLDTTQHPVFDHVTTSLL